MGYSGIGQGISIGKGIWLYPTVERVLKLSGIKKDTKVVIYTDVNRNKNIFDAFYTAANNLSDNVIAVIGKPGTGGHGEKSREPDRQVIELMKSCDVVIDMPTNHWCYTDAYNEVLDSGTKILLSCSDEELLVRLEPCEEIAKLTDEAADIISKGDTVKILSEAGTDLTMSIKGRKCNPQAGYISETRRWDNFPSGITEIAPVEDSANGVLVINPGDPIVELNKLAEDQIKCYIKDGRIIEIHGGNDARLLREWLEQWNDPAVKVIAHVGFGTDHRATIFSPEAMDWESFLGGVNVAFGANFARFLNGKNRAKAHLDIIIRNATFYVDDKKLVDKGKLLLK